MAKAAFKFNSEVNYLTKAENGGKRGWKAGCPSLQSLIKS